MAKSFWSNGNGGMPRRYRSLHVSLQPHRLRSRGRYPPNPEAFYAQHWRELNPQGRDILSLILAPSDSAPLRLGVDYSPRDAAVAATVIQWLGTNVGRAFVWECESRIKKATEQQNAVRAQRRLLKVAPDDNETQLRRDLRKLRATRERIKQAGET